METAKALASEFNRQLHEPGITENRCAQKHTNSLQLVQFKLVLLDQLFKRVRGQSDGSNCWTRPTLNLSKLSLSRLACAT